MAITSGAGAAIGALAGVAAAPFLAAGGGMAAVIAAASAPFMGAMIGLVPAMFIVNTINLEEVFSSNGEVEQYSFYSIEKEVLFFPFSSFIVDEKIDTQIIKGIEVKIVNLNYLEKYREEIENKINTLDENRIKELLSKDSKFVKDISSIQLNEDKITKNQLELKKDIQKAVNKVKEEISIKK